MGLLRESSNRDNRSTIVTVGFSLVFLLVHTLVFPRDLGTELFLTAVQTVNLTDEVSEPLTAGGSYFQLAGREGYWDADAKLLLSRPKHAQAVSSGESLAWYDGTADSTVVEGLSGTLFRVDRQKYPFWTHGRLFFMDENRMALTAVDPNGQFLWRKQFSSLISSVDAVADRTAVGTLDGKVQVFDDQGLSSGSFLPGGSRLPVVFNLSLSDDGKSLLVLAGVDPKRLLVLSRGASDYRPVFHAPLDENKPWPTWLGFLDSGRTAYYEAQNALALLDLRDTQREVRIPVAGDLQQVEYLESLDLVLLVSGSDTDHRMQLHARDGRLVFRSDFQAADFLVSTQGGRLILAADQSLITLEMREE